MLQPQFMDLCNVSVLQRVHCGKIKVLYCQAVQRHTSTSKNLCAISFKPSPAVFGGQVIHSGDAVISVQLSFTSSQTL